MKNVLALIAVASIGIGILPSAEAQRRSSGRSKSSSVRSSVRVKGYFRKNGTYVAPHYRIRPNKSRYDNWSYKGNINPFTGKVGTKEYPLGVWWSPIDAKTTYNTPFGFMVDYDEINAGGVLVTDAPASSPIKRGYRIKSYRIGTGVQSPIDRWEPACVAALDAEAKTITLIGQTDKGDKFTADVPVSGPEHWFGGEEEEEEAREIAGIGLIVGVNHTLGADTPSVVGDASPSSNLTKGCTIDGVRETSDKEFTKVTTWGEFEAFVNKRKASAGREVVVTGTKRDGSRFTSLVTLK